MVNRKIEEIRKQLNEMIVSDNIDEDKLLEKSKELDLLILQFIKDQKSASAGSMMPGDGVVKENEVMYELESLLNKVKIFDKMYQAMGIVDPVTKKVLELEQSELHETHMPCYEFWEKGRICDNCISMRAFNEDDTIFKIECKDDNIYMVTAIPVMINDRRLVVELLKNITSSLIIGDGKHGENANIIRLVRIGLQDMEGKSF